VRKARSHSAEVVAARQLDRRKMADMLKCWVVVFDRRYVYRATFLFSRLFRLSIVFIFRSVLAALQMPVFLQSWSSLSAQLTWIQKALALSSRQETAGTRIEHHGIRLVIYCGIWSGAG
jgi:hypothetical protein